MVESSDDYLSRRIVCLFTDESYSLYDHQNIPNVE